MMTRRLLFITPRFGTIHRGVEVFTAELAPRLAARGYDVAILSGPHAVADPPVRMIKVPLLRREAFSSLLRVPITAKVAHRLGFGPAEIESKSLMWNARRLLGRSDGFDIVVPIGGLPSIRFARARWPGAKIVCIGQAGIVPKELRYADAFVALIPLDADRAKAANPSIAVAVIANGVDLARLVPAAVPPSEHRLVCVAALAQGKGHEYLLDALLLLPRSVSLTCVGDGPEIHSLKSHPAVTGGRVQFGSSGHDRILQAYQEARAFTLASPEEAFGIVFIEALACGLPVVAHDGPRQRQVLGDAGIFVDVRDPGAYAAALLRAIEEGPRPEQRARALRFGWETIADRYAEFLAALQRRAHQHRPSMESA